MTPEHQEHSEDHGGAGINPQSGGSNNQPRRLSNLVGKIHRVLRERRAKKKPESAADRAARKTATATIFIAIFTFATVAVGASQFFIFKWQLDEMEGAGRQTDKVVAAMQGQLKEMQNQSALTRSMVAAKLISRLGFSPAIAENNAVVGWGITAEWQNVGATEAQKLRNWVALKIDPPSDYVFATDVKMGNGRTVAAGEGFTQETKWIPIETLNKVIARETVIVVYGYMEYRDVFPGTETHEIHWCNLVVPDIAAGKIKGFSFPFYREECNTRK